MKNTLKLACLFLVLISCRNHKAPVEVPPHADFPFENGKSIYDSIAPAKVRIDSNQFYSRLSKLLKFTNNIEWDGGTSFYSAYFVVDENGKLNLLKLSSTPSLEADMKVILDEVHKDLITWEPAHLRYDSSRKVPYNITMDFFIRENAISFEMSGPESEYFFRKKFSRPIKDL